MLLASVLDPGGGLDYPWYMDTPSWIRLDNSANLWPALLNRRYTTLFRLALRFQSAIQINALESALADVVPSFPFFQVKVRPGLFWYGLLRRHDLPPLEADVANPCQNPQLIGGERWPFRVRVWHRQIAVEFSHILTDGTGAVEFVRALGCRYLEYVRTEAGGPVPVQIPGDPGQQWQDPSREHARRRFPPLPSPGPAFHFPGKLEPVGNYSIIHGFMPVAPVLALAKERGLTLTELILTLLFQSCLDLAQREFDEGRLRRLGPIRILVPVNLRKVFQSRTLRNFFAFSDPSLDPRLGPYDFEEIAATVMYTLRRQSQASYLRHQLSRNVAEETPFAKRIAPLFLKNIAINIGWAIRGDRQFTCSFSNLGRMDEPLETDGSPVEWSFVPPPSPVTKTNVTMISSRDTLCITFASLLDDPLWARLFFRRLADLGPAIRIESNREEPR